MANSTLRVDPELLYSNASALDGYSQELDNTFKGNKVVYGEDSE